MFYVPIREILNCILNTHIYTSVIKLKLLSSYNSVCSIKLLLPQYVLNPYRIFASYGSNVITFIVFKYSTDDLGNVRYFLSGPLKDVRDGLAGHVAFDQSV